MKLRGCDRSYERVCEAASPNIYSFELLVDLSYENTPSIVPEIVWKEDEINRAKPLISNFLVPEVYEGPFLKEEF